MGRERSAFHRGPELFPSNEGRIHLRRPTLSLIFRLHLGGGPYIPDGRQLFHYYY
jgi:hypothetical protein